MNRLVSECGPNTYRIRGSIRHPVSARVGRVGHAQIARPAPFAEAAKIIQPAPAIHPAPAKQWQTAGDAVGIPPQQPRLNPMTDMRLYKGDNVHSYTGDIRNMLQVWLPKISEISPHPLTRDEFVTLCSEIEQSIGTGPVFSNLLSNYHDNVGIIDNDLPGLDGARLLHATWVIIKQLAQTDSSIIKHFKETMDQIGATCIQGVTHRLFCDFVSIIDAFKPVALVLT